MKVRLFALLACVAMVGMAACSEDPTDAGNLEPSAIVTSVSLTHKTPGTKFQIVAYAIDKNNARLTGALAGSLTGGAVTIDSMPYVPELQETRFFLNAQTPTEGVTLTITGHGLTKDVTVIVEE
jgi:ABC-type glycerol-3-phosphate transport system substrate-binding protein